MNATCQNTPELPTANSALQTQNTESNPPNLKVLDDPSAPPTLNFERQTLNSSPTRVGKIARLPFEIREQVNELLRAGRTYSRIVAELEKLGHSGISERNVGNWKHGGYVDWLRERQQSEARLALPQALERCVRSGKIDQIQQNALLLGADQLMNIMGLFDHQRAVNLLYHKPELFPRYVSALASLARCSADLAKSFDLTQNREGLIRKQLPAAERGLQSAEPEEEPRTTDEVEPPSPSPSTGSIPPVTPIIPIPPIPGLESRLQPATLSETQQCPATIHEQTNGSPSPVGRGRGEGEGTVRLPTAERNKESSPQFQIPRLGIERTAAELLHLLRNGKNGKNGSHPKANVTKRK